MNAVNVSDLTFIKASRIVAKKGNSMNFYNMADGVAFDKDLCIKHVLSILMSFTLYPTFILRLADYDKNKFQHKRL